MPAWPEPGSSLMFPTSVVVDTTEPEKRGGQGRGQMTGGAKWGDQLESWEENSGYYEILGPNKS